MLSALKNILGIKSISHSEKCTEAPLFSGSAYFSNRVPTEISQKWVTHGGEISSGTTMDVRARYFFAIDPSEPWVTKLFSKSVVVIHAGWIVHCVDEAFKVPISEYILDDKFIPEHPYKLTSNIVQPIYVPLSEPEPSDTEYDESRPVFVQTSDMPSTPTSMPRKRKREQAYFDSPSGSLVFSGFDKDGMPRRPRKQRKLRFDPSFSPGSRIPSRETAQGTGLEWLQDHHCTARDNDEFRKELGRDGEAGTMLSYMSMGHSPDTPDKSLSNEGPSATYQRHSADEHISKLAHEHSLANSMDPLQEVQPVRTIDFTNLPPPSRRRRFLTAEGTKSGDTDMIPSVVKSTDQNVRTPKKISFADRARVCVYLVSPRQPDTKDGVYVGPTLVRRSLSEGFGDGPDVDGEALVTGEVMSPDDSTTETTKIFAPQTDLDPKICDDSARISDGSRPENDTLLLTMEEVQTMRCRLESAAKNSGNSQLATLFEVGKTYRGMTFHHRW